MRPRDSRPDRSPTPCIARSADIRARRRCARASARPASSVTPRNPPLRPAGYRRPDRRPRTAPARRPTPARSGRRCCRAWSARSCRPDFAFGDRIADVVPARHLVPVGVNAAGRLRAAFQDVTDQAAGGEPVVVVGLSSRTRASGCRARARYRAAAGDHDVGAAVERGRNRQRTEIGIGGEQPRRQRLAGRQLRARSARAVRSIRGITSSPSTTAIFSSTPSSAHSASSARLPACGLTPPPLLTTLMPRRASVGQRMLADRRRNPAENRHSDPSGARAPKATWSLRRDNPSSGNGHPPSAVAGSPSGCRPRRPTRRRC